jgi:uncharacterized membrane protein YeiB
LLFLCAGIVIGRRVPLGGVLRLQLVFLGILLVAGGYLLARSLPVHPLLRSTHPFDRGVLYSVTALGTAIVAASAVGWIAARTAASPITRALAVTGRTTLTLYVLHVLMFNLLVDWLEWVHPAGLGTALVFALSFWLFAIVAANAWHRRFAFGPLEWVYRRFSA